MYSYEARQAHTIPIFFLDILSPISLLFLENGGKRF